MVPLSALTDDEREAIVLAAKSVFAKLRNLYRDIVPKFTAYGFTPPSAGVIARDLSEKIEIAIVQHCSTFSKGDGPVDLSRNGEQWEVKICKGSGLTINQSKRVDGECYIVVNYSAESQVTAVWVLWRAQESFFSRRLERSNARGLVRNQALESIEILYKRSSAKTSALPAPSGQVAKAALPRRSLKKHG